MNDFDGQTVQTALNILQSEFFLEDERDKYFQSKTQTMITVSTIILTASAFLAKLILDKSAFTTINLIILTICDTFALIGIVYFTKTLKTQHFKRINYEPLLNPDELRKSNTTVQMSLINSYRQALENNSKIVNKKALFFNIGSKLLNVSLILLFITLILTYVSCLI